MSTQYRTLGPVPQGRTFTSSLVLACLVPFTSPAAESVPPAPGTVDSLVTLARKVRPDLFLGSMAGGLDPGREGNQPLADFFLRNFNIMTVGVYMKQTQREPGAYSFEKTDALIAFGHQNNLKVILNEWANETTRSPRAFSFLTVIQALREESVPVDGAGLQLHSRLKDGKPYCWANNIRFDLDAFTAMLKHYEQAGIEVHITEFDIHLGPNPTPEDFALQGTYYAEVLRHALQSPAVKSFKTCGFTDRHSWKADGKDGHPLLLDGQFQPKPAYVRQLEMLRSLALRKGTDSKQ